jgi:hypothetical protein
LFNFSILFLTEVRTSPKTAESAHSFINRTFRCFKAGAQKKRTPFVRLRRYANTRKDHANRVRRLTGILQAADPSSVLWRFPESDPLEDCELLFQLYFSCLLFTFHCCPGDNVARNTEKASRISVCMEKFFRKTAPETEVSLLSLFAEKTKICHDFRKKAKKNPEKL